MCAFSVLLWENNNKFHFIRPVELHRSLLCLIREILPYFAKTRSRFRNMICAFSIVLRCSKWRAEELRFRVLRNKCKNSIQIRYKKKGSLIQVTSGSFRDTLWIFRMLFVSKLSATLDRIKLSLWEKFCDSGFGVISSHVSRKNGGANINLHSFRSALATLVFSEELRS